MGQAKEATIIYSGAAVAGMFLGIANAAAITARSRVFEFALSSHATPVDQSSLWSVMRTTTAVPTGGSTPTIAYNDPADGVALATAYAASTGGATLVTAAPLYQIGLHQKASFRWVASSGREFVNPITTLLGIGIILRSGDQTAAYNGDATFCWEE
jgi:hypothetical protein